MKKFILTIAVVSGMAIASCSSSECSCDADNNASAQSAINNGIGTAKENEDACNALNSAVKIFHSGASCTWG